MNLSRTFSLGLGVFILLSTLAYLFIDFRPTREQAYKSFQNKRLFTVLNLYKGERFLEEEDYAILSLALDGIAKEINQKPSSKSRIRSAEIVERRYGIGFENKGHDGEACIHFNDPYFPYLKKHAFGYQMSLLAKSDSTYFCNLPQVNSDLLIRIILEDPSPIAKETSNTIRNLFNSNLNKIGNLETSFFREVMHYLVQNEKSIFYGNLFQVAENKANLNESPGIENSIIGQLKLGNELFCYDEDLTNHLNANNDEIWKKCFSIDIFRSGWVLSGQIKASPPDPEIISQGRKRFSNLEFFTIIDFDNWNERLIPHHFHGNYRRTDRILKHGEFGFRMYRPQDGRVELICRKFSGRKNYIEIFFELETADLPIPIAELQLVQAGMNYSAFQIAADKNSILLNKTRIAIDRPAQREILTLKIASGNGGFVRGTLIHKNKGVIENMNSYPIDEKILKNKGYSWEICLPQAVERSKESALLYGFRIGREE